jgi:hypothetical protein
VPRLNIALALAGMDPSFAQKMDPPEGQTLPLCHHGFARENAARKAIPQRTRPSAASRIRCAGLQKAQPVLDPAPRRKALLARANTGLGGRSIFVSENGSVLMSVEDITLHCTHGSCWSSSSGWMQRGFRDP